MAASCGFCSPTLSLPIGHAVDLSSCCDRSVPGGSDIVVVGFAAVYDVVATSCDAVSAAYLAWKDIPSTDPPLSPPRYPFP